jgi:integrase
MAKVKFTAGRVTGFKCEDGKGQSFLWDSEAPGLGLRATASGAKSYMFQSKLNGQAIRVTIGAPGTWAIQEAQAEARRLKVITDNGQDPRIQKAEVQADQAAKREASRHTAAPAMDAWDAYLKARTPRWSARSLLEHERLNDAGGKAKTRGRKKGEGDTTLPGVLRPLLALPLKQIDADRVRQWLQDEVRRPTVAMSAFVRLRAFLNWCATKPEYKGQAHADACATRTARDELPKPSVKDDCLQREQLPLWFDAVRKLSNPVIGAYLQSLLLTGARREELAGLKWDDVDFQWGSLSIRDKVEGSRTIPLPPYVAHLLAALPRRNQWVFSSPTAASGRIQEPRTAHNKALDAAALPHLSIHGLRRSFGTLSEWVECPAGVVAQIMGHKPSAIAEKHYIRRPLDLLRMWHIKIEGWMLEQAAIDFVPVAPGLRVVAAA